MIHTAVRHHWLGGGLDRAKTPGALGLDITPDTPLPDAWLAAERSS